MKKPVSFCKSLNLDFLKMLSLSFFLSLTILGNLDLFLYLPVQSQNYAVGIISGYKTGVCWGGIGITLSQWVSVKRVNPQKFVHINSFTQFCVADSQVSRKSALLHKWLQKQGIKVMSIYQKLVPSEENMKPKPIHLNFAQL